MNKVMFEIDNCCDCLNSYQERVYTPDPFELETGCYCSKVEDKHSYNRKHKLVAADEDVREYAQIPDWCPLLKQKKQKNIIFLDIDGVLNSMLYVDLTKGKGRHTEIDESRLPLLKRIVEENDAEIVLSSTWRNLADATTEEPEVYEQFQYLVKTLWKYGLAISERTPYVKGIRPLEIKEWLSNRLDRDNINWISIEDDFSEKDYEEYGMGGRLIETKYFTRDASDAGLQEKHVKMARELFERQKRGKL